MEELEAIGTIAPMPETLTAKDIAVALAVLVVDIVGVVPDVDQTALVERLANRLDDQARVPNGAAAAALLGGISSALMAMEY